MLSEKAKKNIVHRCIWIYTANPWSEWLLLLSHFSPVQLCATPKTAARQAPPSLGFSRQEHWSGLPFPSPIHESENWSEWHVSIYMWIFSINKHSTTWSILVESEVLELQLDDYGTWAHRDFGIHAGSWNQSPTDTKGGLCECVCMQFCNATHIKMAIQLKVSRNSCSYVVQWIVNNLIFVIMKVPQSMENCDSFPLSLPL